MKLSEDEVVFKKVQRSQVRKLLEEVSSYVENPRWERSQFEKHLGSQKQIDAESRSMFYGCFEEKTGKCLALACLNRCPAEHDVLIAEVQSVVKGFGRWLLEEILCRSQNAWLIADPRGGEKLKRFYRSFEELKEVEIKDSIFEEAGTSVSLFFMAASAEDAARLREQFKQYDRAEQHS